MSDVNASYGAKRDAKGLLVGPVVGAVLMLIVFAVVAVITSGAAWWWWAAAALFGAICGFAIGPLLSAARDDGNVHALRGSTEHVGDADTPIEGGEAADRRARG